MSTTTFHYPTDYCDDQMPAQPEYLSPRLDRGPTDFEYEHGQFVAYWQILQIALNGLMPHLASRTDF